MDSEETTYTYTQSILHVSEQGLIINSERYVGFSYKFNKKNASQYACASCKTLGKSRIVTVRNGRIYGRKHPEDDHHKELCSQSTREFFSSNLTRDPVSEHSAHDLSVGQ